MHRNRTNPSLGTRCAVALTALATLVVCLPTDAEARKRDRKPVEWDAEFEVGQSYTDNVRRAPDGPRKFDGWYTTIGGKVGLDRIPWRFAPDEASVRVHGNIYNDYSKRDNVEISTRAAYDLGKSDLSFRYSFVPKTLLVDDDQTLGNVYARRHRAGIGWERRFGAERHFRLRLLAEGLWVRSTDSFDERDSDTPSGKVEFRYNRFRPFIPRVEFEYGRRFGEISNYDRDEFDLIVGFDSHIVARTLFQFRFKRSWRDYLASETSGGIPNSNHDREDDSYQYQARLEYTFSKKLGISVQLRYEYRDNDSTKDRREFDYHEGALYLKYRYN